MRREVPAATPGNRALSCSPPGRAGPLKALASCTLGPSLAASSRLRPRRGSHLNFNSPARPDAAALLAVTIPLHVLDEIPRAWSAGSPELKATTDKIKTKQNAHQPPKTARPAPTGRPAPCLCPPPAAPSPAVGVGGSDAPRRAHQGQAQRKRLPGAAQGGGKEPASPARSWKERSCGRSPHRPWGSTSQ